MALTTVELKVYAAGIAIQSGLPPRTGVLLRQLSDATGYSIKTVHFAVRVLQKKRLAGWPLKNVNCKRGALRFRASMRKSA